MSRHLHEVREIRFHGVIDVLVFVGRNLEILLQLPDIRNEYRS